MILLYNIVLFSASTIPIIIILGIVNTKIPCFLLIIKRTQHHIKLVAKFFCF